MTKQWAKSTNGPDEIDVESLMRAIGAIHSAHVGVMFSPLGTGSSGGLLLRAMATFERLPGSALPDGVGVDKEWPHKDHKTLWGCVFALLHELDFAIGEVYQNEALWE